MPLLLLPLVAVCLAGGVLVGSHLQFSSGWIIAITLALSALALWWGRRHVSRYLLACGCLALWCGVGLAVGRGGSRTPPTWHVSRHADGRTIRRVVARVVREPTATRSGWRVLLEVQAVVGLGPTCGRMELHLPLSDLPDLTPGDRIMLRGRLRPITGNRNPGAASATLRVESDAVGAAASTHGDALALIDAAPVGVLAGVRTRVRRLIGRHATGPSRQILGALVLGERGAIDPAVRRDFARAGVSHLLAVSGLHLTLMAGGLLWCVRWLLVRVTPLSRRIEVRQVAAPVALAAAVGYTLLTGAAPSTVRACVMAGACFIGLCTHRVPDLLRPLCLAAVVLLVLDPINLFRPGFQLSFLAVGGIALALAHRLPGGGLWPVVANLMRATVAATLITAPVVAYHFHEVSIIGLLVNLVAIPLTTLVVLPLSLVGCVAGLAHPTLGGPLVLAAAWTAERLHQLCTLASRWELSVMHWSPGPLTTAAVTSLVLGWMVRRAGNTRPRAGRGLARALLLGGGVMLSVAGGHQIWRRISPRMELTFLDVGQGDSTFVRFPDGGTMLVDAGGSHLGGWDVGAARVVPFLQGQGHRRLDLVVASHPHPDHVAGLVAVLEQVEVGELWVCWHDEPNSWLQRLLAVARRRGVPVRVPRLLRRGDVTVRPLWPPRARDGTAGATDRCADPAHEANDNSIVLRLEYGRAAAVLAGDIEELAERALLQERGILAGARSQVLKVPHHGSSTSSTTGFVAAVAPRLVVISCGAGNSFGFPHPTVLRRYRRMGADVARTDVLGAVSVELWSDGEMHWAAVQRPVGGSRLTSLQNVEQSRQK